MWTWYEDGDAEPKDEESWDFKIRKTTIFFSIAPGCPSGPPHMWWVWCVRKRLRSQQLLSYTSRNVSLNIRSENSWAQARIKLLIDLANYRTPTNFQLLKIYIFSKKNLNFFLLIFFSFSFLIVRDVNIPWSRSMIVKISRSIVFTLELLTLEKLGISLLRNLYGIDSDIATLCFLSNTQNSSIFKIFCFHSDRRPANITLINLNDLREIRKFNARIYVDLRNDGILRLKLFIIVDDAEKATRYPVKRAPKILTIGNKFSSS